MKLKVYIANAFSEKKFGGDPAGINERPCTYFFGRGFFHLI
jgi:predicted PhzF superfamily epimerase YddE/YHI9